MWNRVLLVGTFCSGVLFSQVPPIKTPQIAPPPDLLDMMRKAQQLKLQQLEIQQRERDLQRLRDEAAARQNASAQTADLLRVPSISSFMKGDQFTAAGLPKLTDSEMGQLNQWFGSFVNNYSRNLWDNFTRQAGTLNDLNARSQSIGEVSSSGEIVTMLDGSKWRVDTLDTLKTSLWLPVTTVVIVQAGTSTQKAVLIRDGDAVHAARIP